MAEFEVADEVIDETLEGIDGEAEGMEDEELMEEVADTKDNISKLGKALDSLKAIDVTALGKSFAIFIAKNTAIGALFYGVTFALQKLIGKATDGEKPGLQKKQKTIKAISQVISELTKVSKKVADWAKAKEDVLVDVGEGVTVPLPDLLSKCITSLKEDVETAFETARQLIKKDGAGKTTGFFIPTIAQVNQIIDSSVAVCGAIQEMVNFVNDKKARFPELGTFAIGQTDVNKLNDDINNVKKLPYA